MLVDGDLSRLPDQQCVAVGRSGCHRMRADRAAGARAIFDHDRLAKRRTKLVRDRARNDIAGAAGRVGDNQLNGPVGIGLAPTRCRVGHGEKGRDESASRRPDGPHDRSSLFLHAALVPAIVLFEAVKSRRVIRQGSLGQFRRISRSQEIVDQCFVAKTTIRRRDGATHMLVPAFPDAVAGSGRARLLCVQA